MTALYSVALAGGAAIAAGLTVPLEHATGFGWRVAITLWGGSRYWRWSSGSRTCAASGTARPPRPGPVRGLWRDPLAWSVSGFMGLQSFGFYALLSWLPTIFPIHGMSAAHAGWLLSYPSFFGMLAALMAPSLERRLRRPGVVLVFCVVARRAGYVGLIAAPVSGPTCGAR